MKWIGQHIWDLTSRFRNDVYLEDLTEVEQEFTIQVAADGKLTKSTAPSERSRIQVRNDEGSVIPAGAPLYSKGEIGGSNRIKVGICVSSDPAKMPCIGIAEFEMNTSNTKDSFAVTQGVYNTNISGFTGLTEGDILYVNGGVAPHLTPTKPTNGSLIQNVGIVLKAGGGGTICQGLLVSAIGRTNDVPWPLYVDHTTQRVGIGTSSPTTKLHITDGSETFRYTSDLGDNFRGIELAGVNPTLKLDGSANTFNISALGLGLAIWDKTSGAYRFSILNNGNVGIGTTSPSQKLDVNGSMIADTYYVSNTSNYIDIATGLRLRSNSDGIRFMPNGTDTVKFLANGNVGIGTTTPTSKLHVIGDARIQGNLTVNGTYTQIDTDVNTTEQWLVTNDGTGPAAVINQLGTEDIFDVQDDGTSVFYIEDGGNIGIGTTTPNEKLEVDGNIRLANSGKLYLWQTHDANYLQYYRWELNSSLTAYINNAGSGGVALKTAGNTRLFVDSSGNVGIGTTSPQSPLHVHSGDGGTYSPNSSHDDLTIEGSGNIGLQLFSPNSTYQYIAFGDPESANAGYVRYHHGSNTMVLRTNNQDRVNIDSSGNVGIGTTSPTVKLDVSGGAKASGTIAAFGNDTSGFSGHGMELRVINGVGSLLSYNRSTSTRMPAEIGGSYVMFDVGGAEKMRVDTSGNVGIGTASPSEKLEVDGNVTISGYYYADTHFQSKDSNATLSAIGGGGVYLRPNGAFSTTGQFIVHHTTGNVDISGNLTINNTYPRIFLTDSNHNDDWSIINNDGKFGVYNDTDTSYALSINGANNVGIGTTSPTEKLHVEGRLRLGTTPVIASHDTITIDIDQNNNQADNYFRVTKDGEATELFRVQEDGNVGIGTTSPAAGLQVALGGTIIPAAGASTASAVFGNSTSDNNYGVAIGANSSGVGYISSQRTDGTATTYNLAIQPNGGNVGIGTDSPSSKLHVAGEITTEDQINFKNFGGSLLRFTKDSWTSAPNHDLIYQGWDTTIDDYIYLKAPGNTTTTHGVALIGDGVIALGRTDAETGAPELTSAAAPLDDNWLVLNSTGATFSGNIAVSGTVDGVDIGANYANWNTAYSWGNHASAGYLTSSSTQSKYLRSDAVDYFTGKLNWDGADYTDGINMSLGNIRDAHRIDANEFFQSASGRARNNLGDPTVTEMALFEEQFKPQTTLANDYDDLTDLTFWYQETSSSSWVEDTSYSDDQKRKFLRTNNSSVIIPNTYYKFRVEFKAKSYTFANAMYMYWSSQSHNTQVHVWKKRCSDGTWLQHTSSTNTISSWPGHGYLPFSKIAWHETNTTSTGHFTHIRFEFTPNWIPYSGSGTDYSTRNINLYGMQIWGGYPSGRRTPHYYDQNGEFNFLKDAHIHDNQTLYIGTGGDLQIYHDGSNSYIDDVGTGNLKIRSNRLQLEKYTGETMAEFIADGASSLYYDNNKKLETTSSGVEVQDVLQVTTDGTATLILRGDNNNSDDTGQLDSTIKMLHDDGTHGILMETKNFAGKQRFEIKSLAAGTESSRFLIHEDNYITTSGDITIGPKSNATISVSESGGADVKMRAGSVGRVGTYSNHNFVITQNSADAITIDTSRNVGIGATSPSYKLDVDGEILSDGLRLNLSATTQRAITSTGTDSIQIGDAGVNEFKFKNTAGTSMMIAASGNVGIGTTSPGSQLEISKDSDDGTNAPVLSLTNASTTLNDGANVGIIQFKNSDLSGTGPHIATIKGVANSSDERTTELAFSTGNVATTNEAMRIDSSGNVGIGITNPAYVLDTHSGTTNVAARFKSGDNQAWISVQDDDSGTYGALFGTDSDAGHDIVLADRSANKRLIIDSSGKVGIGVTNPVSKLHVYENSSNTTNNAGLTIENDGGGDAVVQFLLTGDRRWVVGIDNSDSNKFKISQTTDLSGGDAPFVIDTSGNVGIGTTSPGQALHLPDNKRIAIGTGQDSQWYHDGSNTYLKNATGDLYIQNSASDKDIIFQSDDGSGGLTNYFKLWGAVESLAVYKDMLFIYDGDGGKLKFGASQDLQIYHNGTNSNIENFTGTLQIVQNADDGDITLRCDDGSGGTTPYLTIDGSATRTNVHKDLRFDDNIGAVFGSGAALKLHSDGSNGIIDNYQGNLIIRQQVDDADIAFQCDDGSGGVETYFFLDGSEGVVNFPDDKRLTFGTGRDLFLYHDGINATLKNYVGDIRIQNEANDKDIIFNCDDGSGGVTPYLTLDGGLGFTTLQKNLRANDDVRILVGSGQDAEFFHDGANTSIRNTTGDLQIRQAATDKDIIFKCDDGSGGETEYFRVDGGSEKTIYTKPISLLDSVGVQLGTGTDAQIYHTGSEGTFINYTGNFRFIQSADNADLSFYSDDGSGGTAEYFRVDGGATKTIVSKEFQFFDSVKAEFGDSSDLQIYHNGTNSAIDNLTGDLYISNYQDDGDIIFRTDDGSGGHTQYLRIDGGGGFMAASKSLYMLDNNRLYLGSAGDLEMYHDGSNSFVRQVGTGHLYFDQTVDDYNIYFRCDDGSGGVTTYFRLNGSSGETVVSKDIRWEDSVKAKFGAGSDLQIYHDGSNSYIDDTGTGHLNIRATNLQLLNAAGNKYYASFADGGDAKLFYNGSEKLATTSTGVEVTGNISLTGSVQKQIQVFPMNFVDDLGTDKHFMPFVTNTEQTVVYQEEAAMVMPADGRVVSVTVHYAQMDGTDGNITVGIETSACGQSYANPWTVEETETIAASVADDHHVFHFAFDNAKHFESTDKIAISIQQSTDMQSAARFFWVTAVIEYDWSTFLGGTSAEYTTTP